MVEKVTKEDIGKIEKSTTNIYHLLRHFPKLDSSYTDRLIGQEYEYYDYTEGKYVPSTITEKDIEDAYKTQGSKFFPGIKGLETPHKLIDVITHEALALVENGELEWISEERFKKAEFTCSYPEDIGYKGVIDIDELTEEEKKEIERVPRGNEGILINVIKGIERKPTNKLAIGMYKRFDTGKVYITAFPGFICPSLPSKEQTEEERSISELFWSMKVFVE